MINRNPIDSRLALRPGLALGMLLCLMLFFLIAISILVTFLGTKMENQTAFLRISAVLQDTFIFIIPAIVTAMLATRYQAWLLQIQSKPSLRIILLTFAVMLLSTPVMNLIVEWNEGIRFPESLAGLESQMRSLETAAQESVKVLLGNGSVASLVMAILIVGIYAGFSEELLFRGIIQRLTGFVCNPHVAIWLTAFIFSAFHLQFYGFIPRMLLGAFFGYLLYWSGSLWLPVTAHIFNNSLVSFVEWLQDSGMTEANNLSTIGSDISSATDISMAIVSAVFIVGGIVFVRHYAMRDKKAESIKTR